MSKKPPSINSTASHLTSHQDNKSHLQNYPTDDWHKLGTWQWQPSDLTQGLYQTTIDIGRDIQLCVEAGGNPNNPSLILIMGLGSQMLFWPDEFVNRLIQAGYFVIRFDNRDIGLSSKIRRQNNAPTINQLKMMLRMQVGLSNASQPVPYTLDDMAEDTVELIHALNLPSLNHPIHLLGASMGGMIAQIVCAKYPQLISHLVLMFTTNNQAFLPPPKPKQLSTLLKSPASLSEQDIVKYATWFVNTVGSPGFINQNMVHQKALIHYHRDHNPLGSAQQLNAILASGSIRQYSQKVQAPTLILHGSEDGLLPPSHGRSLAKSIPNAKFHLIKGMGHDLASYYLPYLHTLICQHLLEK